MNKNQVKGGVGPVGAFAIARAEGNADTGPDLQVMPVDGHRRRYHLEELEGELEQLRKAGPVGQQAGELVTPEPAHHVLDAHRMGKARCDDLQYLVAGSMAVPVVDRLEPVQVDVQDG